MSRPARIASALVLVASISVALAPGPAAGTPAGVHASGASAGVQAAGASAEAIASAGRGRGVKKRQVGSFDSPVHLAAAPGVKAAYVVEQPGTVRVIRRGHKRKRPFLNISGSVLFGGEQGLLSIAFHPDFRQNRLVYLYYTNSAGDNVVAEVKARGSNALVARPGTLRTVLVIPHPGQNNHNGGQLDFGPGGLLYIGSGDGGGGRDPDDSAQDPGSLLGKILRIDPRQNGGQPYTAPSSNPYVGRPGRDEVFSIGLRNPYRFSIDELTAPKSRIVIGDVGQDTFEEVDVRPLSAARGGNFGWNDFEGFATTTFGTPPQTTQHLKPTLVYGTGNQGRCAVIGGFAVRDRRLKGLRGRIVYGDFCGGDIRSFVLKGSRARRDRATGINLSSLSSFGEGPGGSLYATSLAGPVFRIVPTK